MTVNLPPAVQFVGLSIGSSIIAWCMRRLLDETEYEARREWRRIQRRIRRERRGIIHIHERGGHRSPLKHCLDDRCARLSPQTAMPVHLVEPDYSVLPLDLLD